MTVGQPSDLTGILLSFVFALACRWVKRNPSNFLRFVLFPFGGLNVDRWPRFMLLCVRLCAIAGFFVFCLSGLHPLLSLNAKVRNQTGLYAEVIVAFMVSIFALRGSGEEIVERVSSARMPHPLADTEAISARAASHAHTTTGGASASGQPTQPRLSDVEAPPVPRRAYPESAASEKIVEDRKKYALSAIGLGLGWGTVCFLLGAKGMAIFFVAIYLLVAILRIYSKNAPVATCPFCGDTIQGYNAALLRKEPVRCPNCSEYSQFALGLLVPVSPDGPLAIMEKPFYRSPLYENAVWPNGCVLCGAPPTHFDESDHLRFLYRRLAAPMAAFVMPHPAAHAWGIPYCSRHRNAVQVVAPKELLWSPSKYFPGFAERDAARRAAYLLWRSLPMMRRYLAANKQAHSTVSKGYRAPNLFQRIVTGSFRPSKPRGT